MPPSLPQMLIGLPATPLADALAAALGGDGPALGALHGRAAANRRDRALTLLSIYDLHTAPLELLGETVRHQGDPAVADLKQRLEATWVADLEQAWRDTPGLGGLPTADRATPDEAVRALRAVAARDRLPAVYRWLAEQASWPELLQFLALEGGPDGGFDDLVAICQLGLAGSAKLALAKNYWDEMGNGQPDAVHTVLHQQLVAALGLTHQSREQQPLAALERSALSGLLATNRRWQPEMIGALGLLELQAGPRCRLVLQAFDRLNAPAGAYPFYLEHAEVDPVHGLDWTEQAVAPLVAEHPGWGPRIVRGAWWRATVNLAFFQAAQQLTRTTEAA